MTVVSIPEIPGNESFADSSLSFSESSSAFSFDADVNLVDIFIRGYPTLPPLPTSPPSNADSDLRKRRRHRLSTMARSFRDRAVRKVQTLCSGEQNDDESSIYYSLEESDLAGPFSGTHSNCNAERQELERVACEAYGDSSLEYGSIYSYECSYEIPYFLFNLLQVIGLERYVVSRTISRDASESSATENATENAAAGGNLPEKISSLISKTKRFLSEQSEKHVRRSTHAFNRVYNPSRALRSSMNGTVNAFSRLPTEFGPAGYLRECAAQDWPNAFETSSSIEDLGSFHGFDLVSSSEDSSSDTEIPHCPALAASKDYELETGSRSRCETLLGHSFEISGESGENYKDESASASDATHFAADQTLAPECATEPVSSETLRAYEKARADIQARLAAAGFLIQEAVVHVPEGEPNAAAKVLQPMAYPQQAVFCNTNDESDYDESDYDDSSFKMDNDGSHYAGNSDFTSVSGEKDVMCDDLNLATAQNLSNATECCDDVDVLSEQHGYLEELYTNEMFEYIDEAVGFA
ncbi:hypothetical protein METSCH_B08110 [Metschnikowia aff. pulcherrima]|uniref:Uncharacterized protein n=1 Tax=Metschnikowia aff. pulcherrima TaxID=2163413 RepID=A0A4P6XPH6_9ASCO|nr:hypothetical protein METSCH_B08110 [Metschnikowia aff. pulcherrima]